LCRTRRRRALGDELLVRVDEPVNEDVAEVDADVVALKV